MRLISRKKYRGNNNNRGQIVLILVLVLVVGLTVGLSLLSRSVTDIRMSSQIEQSGRAFSAAEAGIENALQGATVGTTTGNINMTGGTAQYRYQVQSFGGGSPGNVTVFPNIVDPGKSITLWLSPHNSSGALDESGSGSYPTNYTMVVCWGKETGTTPAMVASLYYIENPGPTQEYKVAFGAFDPDATRRSSNGFLTADSTGSYCASDYRFRRILAASSDITNNPLTYIFGIPANSRLLLLRVQPVYESTFTAFRSLSTGTTDFPSQGKIISSVGQTSTGIQRKIQVTQGFYTLPALFDYSLFTSN